MNEHQLRGLIDEVKSGKLPRRGFIQQIVSLGLSAPMASMMLMHAGVAQAQTPPCPTNRPSAAAAARSSCCGGRARCT